MRYNIYLPLNLINTVYFNAIFPCFAWEPDERPRFTELFGQLEALKDAKLTRSPLATRLGKMNDVAMLEIDSVQVPPPSPPNQKEKKVKF